MKASTALIRAKETQISGRRYDGNGGYCAIGILDKVAFDRGGSNSERYFNVDDNIVKCPVCKAKGELYEVICHLNNDSEQNAFETQHGYHSWKFKQIGHWLKDIGL